MLIYKYIHKQFNHLPSVEDTKYLWIRSWFEIGMHSRKFLSGYTDYKFRAFVLKLCQNKTV